MSTLATTDGAVVAARNRMHHHADGFGVKRLPHRHRRITQHARGAEGGRSPRGAPAHAARRASAPPARMATRDTTPQSPRRREPTTLWITAPISSADSARQTSSGAPLSAAVAVSGVRAALRARSAMTACGSVRHTRSWARANTNAALSGSCAAACARRAHRFGACTRYGRRVSIRAAMNGNVRRAQSARSGLVRMTACLLIVINLDAWDMNVTGARAITREVAR
ncbi:MAG: hypothetical protein KatS3mg058_2386 [Roseiflexus sp.]|nr:MAG: hypothetical protein KatS3mg058_2386 [Roseiflexus sp.]